MTAPPAGLAIARVDDVADPGALAVEVAHEEARWPLVLTRKGAAIAAFHNRCAHAGHPLQRGDGRVMVQEGRYLVCAVHFASFELESGACAGGPCNGDALERIAIVVRDGAVWTG